MNLSTLALVNQLMNLSTNELCENICVLHMAAREQILMIKIQVHRRHFF